MEAGVPLRIAQNTNRKETNAAIIGKTVLEIVLAIIEKTDLKNTVKNILLSMRPSQWTKNAVVLAAFFFAFWDPAQSVSLKSDLPTAIIAVFLFCVISSGIYLLNDILDVKADRAHPIKCRRPIASEQITIQTAWLMCFVLIVTGLLGAYLASFRFAVVALAYVAIQIIYSAFLKNIALLDIFVIAAGFVLRAIAGAVVLNVDISAWLLLCAFLLALFLALCKRRHEKADVAGNHEQRPSLEKYDEKLLDQLIAVVSAATVVSYSIYTLAPGTQEKFGTAGLGFTIPFVMFGIFRYLDIVYRHKRGDRPEIILLTDIPTIVNILLYAIAVVAVFCLRSY
ncbi:MAG: decaprenyl-phosphate phosphoribosyltransferase [Lentisphaerae bacterium]|nr:decaprenyl-phosphate phosphoribosyltransferase [Lentisphaerota bacterium]